jgi:hypothetical protein
VLDTPERAIYAILSQQWEEPSVALINEYSEDKCNFQQATIAAVKINASYSQHRKHVDALRDKISSTFGVGLDTATRTLQATTQLALHQTILPIHRCYWTQVSQLRYPRLGGIHSKFYTDTFLASTPNLSRCSMGKMHTNDVDFTKFYPIGFPGNVHTR